MTEITQADRDMAARIFGAFGIHGEKIVKAGWADDDDIVKAFARHRMEATEALRVENEGLRKALYAAYDDEPGWCDLARAALGDTK